MTRSLHPAAPAALLPAVRRAMEAYFGADRRRIEHALQVAGHAERLLAYIDADPVLTLAAAYLHDIGIPEAERKFGACPGPLQEQEGPPVARALLQELDAPLPFIEAVCALVGAHHTPEGVDSPEFRILWDADALVNLAEVLPGKSPEKVRAVLERALVTEAGFQAARALYLS